MHNLAQLVDEQIRRWNFLAEQKKENFGFENIHLKEGETIAEDPAQLHPVICISRDLGSGARFVARQLGTQLHYEVFDKAIIDLIAEELDLKGKLLDCLDEKVANELTFVLDTWAGGHELAIGEYLRSLHNIIYTLGTKGGAIIVGRAGGHILKNLSGLNVYITAPFDMRVKRLAEYEKIDSAKAEIIVRQSDKMRAHFARKYFRKRINDPAGYDLCINTDRISYEDAANLILSALYKRCPRAKPIIRETVLQ